MRQADQARTDFAVLESNLEIIMGQLSRLPTRGQLAQAALGITFCSAVLTTLFVWDRVALTIIVVVILALAASQPSAARCRNFRFMARIWNR